MSSSQLYLCSTGRGQELSYGEVTLMTSAAMMVCLSWYYLNGNTTVNLLARWEDKQSQGPGVMHFSYSSTTPSSLPKGGSSGYGALFYLLPPTL